MKYAISQSLIQPSNRKWIASRDLYDKIFLTQTYLPYPKRDFDEEIRELLSFDPLKEIKNKFRDEDYRAFMDSVKDETKPYVVKKGAKKTMKAV